MARCSPTNRLSNDDFPTLGAPASAIWPLRGITKYTFLLPYFREREHRPMTLPDILRALEADAAPDAADRFCSLVTDYLELSRDPDRPRPVPAAGAELARLFDEPLPRTGRSLPEVTRRLAEEVIPNANWLTHPRYLGHQVSAPLPAAIWTEVVIAALNNSLAVEEMSPAGTAIEHQVIGWLTELVGYGSDAGGVFTSGGTEATFTALLAARAAACPTAWEDGISAGAFTVMSGEHAHYSVSRAVGQLGLGTRNLVTIPSRDYRMDPEALRQQLDATAARGRTVMAVVATAGSTPTGSFDELEIIADLCETRGIWLHVDGAHGASALFSPTHRSRVRALARARSISWDPHKMLLLPLPAGTLLVRDERELEGALAQRAPYLFHGEPAVRRVDQGLRSFLCSRRADVLKLWVALQRYGAEGLGALYDHLCATATALYQAVDRRPDFEALHRPECNILCFRYLGHPRRQERELDPLNADLRERFNRSGRGWITTTVLEGRRVLRVTVMNPRTGVREVEELVEDLARLGAG
jgi:L-2,4-diaminobutyrate decarboxylase